MKKTLVMKFGGASVASPDHFSQIAEIILARKQEYERIAIVISAMGNSTDQLIALAKQVHPNPPRREYDMLVSVGERISIALLAMALADKNQQAVSFTGSQSGIITCDHHSSANIIEVRPHRILSALDSGKIVIVAGFQGVSRNGEITTLGRGGSDTSAVALGLALKAECVEFFKDVKGIYSEDPKINPNATLYSHLTYEMAANIVQIGHSVLHPRCIRLASRNQLALYVRSFMDFAKCQFAGTLIGELNQLNQVVVYEEENIIDRSAMSASLNCTAAFNENFN
ncbi:Aspartokinase [Parachlamydia sp. AcF125]|nr:Aspartokinase [Parachlamydia sp. AcF125]